MLFFILLPLLSLVGTMVFLWTGEKLSTDFRARTPAQRKLWDD